MKQYVIVLTLCVKEFRPPKMSSVENEFLNGKNRKELTSTFVKRKISKQNKKNKKKNEELKEKLKVRILVSFRALLTQNHSHRRKTNEIPMTTKIKY